jgi:site-specific recombinase XerC
MRRKPVTHWIKDGKRVPANTPGATPRTRLTAKYYGYVAGREVPLCADRKASLDLLRKRLGDHTLERNGLGDPYKAYRRVKLVRHLKAFRKALRARGNTEAHVVKTVRRVWAVFRGCGFRYPTDLNEEKVSDFLMRLRTPGQTVEVPPGVSFTPRVAAGILCISRVALSQNVRRHALPASGNGKARRLPRSTVEALASLQAQGVSLETVNHYLRALRSFCRWMVPRRMPSNPLAGLKLLNAQVDVRHARRELRVDELRRLLEATGQSAKVWRGLTGEDRAHLYLLAAVTGFRANALARLTPQDFRLHTEPATVLLSARSNKSRKVKIQPVPGEAVGPLRAYLRGRPAGARVWPGTWAKRSADMIRWDLQAAGLPFVVEGSNGPEHVDFHALRHSYLTLLGRSGVDPWTAQELAGHTDIRTTQRYSHRRLDDMVQALTKLPRLTA